MTLDETAKAYGIDTVVRLPINPKLSAACDKGTIELCDVPEMEEFTKKLLGI